MFTGKYRLPGFTVDFDEKQAVLENYNLPSERALVARVAVTFAGLIRRNALDAKQD